MAAKNCQVYVCHLPYNILCIQTEHQENKNKTKLNKKLNQKKILEDKFVLLLPNINSIPNIVFCWPIYYH